MRIFGGIRRLFGKRRHVDFVPVAVAVFTLQLGAEVAEIEGRNNRIAVS